MARNQPPHRLLFLAATAAGIAVAFGQANAASETTRRNHNAIQNYQNQQQTPYYSGQTNPYYGTPPQGARGNPPPPPPPPMTPEMQNRIQQEQRQRNGQ